MKRAGMVGRWTMDDGKWMMGSGQREVNAG